MEKNTGLYLTAVVGVVAIVALAMMVMNSGGQMASFDDSLALSEDLTGQAGWDVGTHLMSQSGGKPMAIGPSGNFCGRVRCDGTSYECYYDSRGICVRGNSNGCNCNGLGGGGSGGDDDGDDDDDDDGDDDDDSAEYRSKFARWR